MADAFTGEIRVFAGNFAPKGWAFCDGSLLFIAQHSTLFSILGVQYGGNGKTTFALPNLNGRAPIGQGQGPGLTPRSVGEEVGLATHTLMLHEMPVHSHRAVGMSSGGKSDPTNNRWGRIPGTRTSQPPAYAPQPSTAMYSGALATAGSTLPHNNMQPYLAMNYIICLDGIFPSRG